MKCAECGAAGFQSRPPGCTFCNGAEGEFELDLHGSLDFESDEPLVCSRDQSGDTTCESCQ